VRFSIDTSSSVIRCAFALLSKDDTDAAFPHGQKEGAYSARGADGSQAPSAMERPIEARRRREGAAPGFGEDQRRRRSARGGLVGRENAKPGVTLLTNSQRGVSPAGEGADTVFQNCTFCPSRIVSPREGPKVRISLPPGESPRTIGSARAGAGGIKFAELAAPPEALTRFVSGVRQVDNRASARQDFASGQIILRLVPAHALFVRRSS
jgi:hypothetical protein